MNERQPIKVLAATHEHYSLIVCPAGLVRYFNQIARKANCI